MIDEMIVTDTGICQSMRIEGDISIYKIIITKEAFIEAYYRYIKGENNND